VTVRRVSRYDEANARVVLSVERRSHEDRSVINSTFAALLGAVPAIVYGSRQFDDVHRTDLYAEVALR
jgi:hypothetical protein